MPVKYQIWIRDGYGNRIAMLDSVPEFQYSIVCNGIGSFEVEIPYNHAKRSFLQRGYRVEIERDYGSGWPSSPTFGGTIRYVEHRTEIDEGVLRRVVVVKGVSYEDMLVSRLTLPDAMIVSHYGFPPLWNLDESWAYEEHSGPAETVMKAFVSRNLIEWDIEGDNRRIPLFTVEPDIGRGKWLSYRDRFAPILEVLQALSAASGLNFSVAGVGSKFEFRVQEAPDRRWNVQDSMYDPIILKETWGRVSNIRYVHDGMQVSNFVYVGGKLPKNEGADTESLVNQPIMVADGTVDPTTGKRISAYPRHEVYVDARGSDNPYDMLVRGAEALEDKREIDTWEFSIQDQPGQRWQVDWNVGDLITVVHENELHDCKVLGVTISINAEGEHINIDDVSVWPGLLDLEPVGGASSDEA